MKKLLTLLAFGLIALSTQAQQDVYLRIYHWMDGAAFTYNQTTANNLGTDFKFSRMQYYISGVTLVHDGGQKLDVPDSWILVTAGTAPTQTHLGQFAITNLEGIHFSIGIDSADNHADPTLYPSTHPLGPKSPSMHWGWSAGYRFVALEGLTGTSLNDDLEIHALGDANYFLQMHSTSGTMVGSDLVVQLDADYTRALDGIGITGGLIYHGTANQGTTALENFRDYVFTVSNAPASGIGLIESQALSFSFGPNPCRIGEKTIICFGNPFTGEIRVVDLLGREIRKQNIRNASQTEFSLQQSGVYLITVTNGKSTITRRLTVN